MGWGGFRFNCRAWIVLVSALLVFQNTYAEEPEYLQTLEVYKLNLSSLIDDQVAPKFASLYEQGYLSREDYEGLALLLNEYKRAALSRIDYFAEAYTDVFLRGNPNSPYRKMFADDEAGMIKGLDGGLEAIFKILRNLIIEANSYGSSSAEQKALRHWIATLDKHGSHAYNPLAKDLDLVLPSIRSKILVGWNYLWRAVIQGQSVFETIGALEPNYYFRDRENDNLVFEGWDLTKAEPGKAVYILGLQHDYAMFDVLMGQRVAEKMNMLKPEPAVLTVTRSWPHFKLRGKRDENVFFTEDPNPVDRLRNYVVNNAERGGLAIVAPEGQVPYFYGQFPVSTKTGAFVLARKTALDLKDKMPVYFLPVYSNAIDKLTNDKSIPLVVTVGEPVLVPTHALSKDDDWVREQRVKFENYVNRTRGNKMVDVERLGFLDSTAVPQSAPVKRLPRLHICSQIF